MPLVLRLLARALSMTPRPVHLSTGFVIILSIAFTSLLICVTVLRSPGLPIGTHLSYADSETLPVLTNYSLESVFDEFNSIKRHKSTESTKDSDVRTAAQLMGSSLPPQESQAHKQEERSTSMTHKNGHHFTELSWIPLSVSWNRRAKIDFLISELKLLCKHHCISTLLCKRHLPALEQQVAHIEHRDSYTIYIGVAVKTCRPVQTPTPFPPFPSPSFPWSLPPTPFKWGLVCTEHF